MNSSRRVWSFWWSQRYKQSALKLTPHMETWTFCTVGIIDNTPQATNMNAEAELYDDGFTFTCQTCLRQTHKPLIDALFRLPNLSLHPVQRKAVGGEQRWIFTCSGKRDSFFSLSCLRRTRSFILCTVHKTKPTQNPCWHTSLTFCAALPPGAFIASPAPRASLCFILTFRLIAMCAHLYPNILFHLLNQ